MGGGQVVDDNHVHQQGGHSGDQVLGHVHHVQGPPGAVDEVHLEPVVPAGHAAAHKPRPTGVGLAQRGEHLPTVHAGVHDHRVDGGAERHTDRALPAVAHAERLPHRARHGVRAEVPHDPVGAVTGALVLFEGLDARGQPRDPLIGLPLEALQLGQSRPGGQVGALRAAEVLVEGALALGVGADTGVDGVELGLGVGHGGAGGGCLGVQPRDLRLGRLHARGERLDLAGEARDALPPVGDRTDRPKVLGLELGQGRLGRAQRLRRAAGPVGGGLHLAREVLLVRCGALGLPVELVGIRAVMDRDLGRERTGAVGRDTGGRAGPLGQGRQGEPPLLGGVGLGGEPVELSLGLRRGAGQLVPAVDRLGDPVGQAGAHALRVGELAPAGDEVVGGQPERRVAQVGLDRLRPPRHLRLSPQRLELASQFGGEVGEPVEVALHPGEFALRLLLAAAVLEDTGGLLDERASLLGFGLEDLGELALTDDHVHLAPDAGVRQQFLHVHEAGAVAVDLVLGGPVAEHPAGQGDLGVVDRQGPVGVVQGERDLGAAERLLPGGAGEDDVLHLPAAQGLGAVLTHDPRQRVHDVGLARAVGADDAADAGLELQGRRRREGLEALERQRLEIHGSRS